MRSERLGAIGVASGGMGSEDMYGADSVGQKAGCGESGAIT